MDEFIDSSSKNVYPPCAICVVTAMITNIADIFVYYAMCDNHKKTRFEKLQVIFRIALRTTRLFVEKVMFRARDAKLLAGVA